MSRSVLVTAYAPLGEPGEWVFPLTPPAVAGRPATAAALALLVDNIRRVRPTFGVEDDDIGALTALCRALGGVPRALEIAAAACTVRSPAQLAEQLAHDPDAWSTWRTTAGNGADLRAATLRALELPAPDAGELLRLLWTLDEPWSVDDAVVRSGSSEVRASELITVLLRHGLVRFVDGTGQPRFEAVGAVRSCGRESAHASTTPVSCGG